MDLEKKLRALFGGGIAVAFAFIALGWLSSPSLTLENLKALGEYSEPAVRLDARLGSFSFWGLATLVAVPFLRTLVTAYAFQKSKETVLAALSALVFFGLLLGLWVGLVSATGH